MSCGKSFCRVLAIVSMLALLLQGCYVQPTSTGMPSSAPQSASASPQSVTASPFVLPSASPSPEEATPSASPTPTPSPVPTPTPTPSPAPIDASKYIIHNYTATDGNKIYYFSDGGIRCVNLDGTNDQKTEAVDFHKFVAIGDKALYYTAVDNTYVFTEQENKWSRPQRHSINLMRIDTKTLQVETIREHLVDVLAKDNKIYMIDHMDHSHFLSYDMLNGHTADITSFSNGVDAYCYSYPDGPMFLFITHEATDDTTNRYEYIESGNGAKVRFDNNNEGVIAVWTGTKYKTLDLCDPFILDSYFKMYLYATKDFSEDSDGNQTHYVTIYEVKPNGSIKKVFGKLSTLYRVSDGGDGGQEVFDIIDGWLFSFWELAGYPTVTDLMVKKHL